MKAQAAARASQGYTKSTPVRCGTCANRDGKKCKLAGFPVGLWAVCQQWTPTRAVTKP